MNKVNAAGFTLIELIIVIVLLGILSASVFFLLPSTSLNPTYEARRVLDDIRYAQALSMASGQRYAWVRLSATTYSIENSSGSSITLPNGSTQVTLTSGVSFGTFTNLPNNLLAFDSQGVPYTATGSSAAALTSTAVIPLTSSLVTTSVQITPQTGYGVP